MSKAPVRSYLQVAYVMESFLRGYVYLANQHGYALLVASPFSLSLSLSLSPSLSLSLCLFISLSLSLSFSLVFFGDVAQTLTNSGAYRSLVDETLRIENFKASHGFCQLTSDSTTRPWTFASFKRTCTQNMR